MSGSAYKLRPRASQWTAVAVGALLILGGGMWYRVKAASYGKYLSSAPIAAGTLARLPMQIGEWQGRDVPMSNSLIQATDSDDHINRIYERSSDHVPVAMFVGYGVRLRDLTPHRPEVCYPGAGWMLVEKTPLQVRGKEGVLLPCQVFRFRRSGLTLQHITVLNYYIVDGSFWPDVSELRKKAAGMDSDREQHYVAQVQVACGDIGMDAGTRGAVEAFAGLIAVPVQVLLEDAVRAGRQVSPTSGSRPSGIGGGM